MFFLIISPSIPSCTSGETMIHAIAITGDLVLMITIITMRQWCRMQEKERMANLTEVTLLMKCLTIICRHFDNIETICKSSYISSCIAICNHVIQRVSTALLSLLSYHNGKNLFRFSDSKWQKCTASRWVEPHYGRLPLSRVYVRSVLDLAQLYSRQASGFYEIEL